VTELLWPVAPPVAEVTEVWVAVVVVAYEVSVRNVPITDQLTSSAMLFAPRVNETRTSAKVVAAATTEQECRQLLVEWKAAHPGTAGEEVVSAVALGRLGTTASAAALPAPEGRCIECHVQIGDGFRCERCTKAYWAALREADPELARG
jgi:hypothetical protein